MTQVPWLELMPNAPAMFGTDTLAMVMSSTATKLAPARTMAASHSKEPLRGPLPASAFSSSVISFSPEKIGYAVGSATVAAGVDGGFHRQAHLQWIGSQLACIQLNAHGHALHHLDPVARGVLRRDGG